MLFVARIDVGVTNPHSLQSSHKGFFFQSNYLSWHISQSSLAWVEIYPSCRLHFWHFKRNAWHILALLQFWHEVRSSSVPFLSTECSSESPPFSSSHSLSSSCSDSDTSLSSLFWLDMSLSYSPSSPLLVRISFSLRTRSATVFFSSLAVCLCLFWQYHPETCLVLSALPRRGCKLEEYTRRVWLYSYNITTLGVQNNMSFEVAMECSNWEASFLENRSR